MARLDRIARWAGGRVFAKVSPAASIHLALAQEDLVGAAWVALLELCERVPSPPSQLAAIRAHGAALDAVRVANPDGTRVEKIPAERRHPTVSLDAAWEDAPEWVPPALRVGPLDPERLEELRRLRAALDRLTERDRDILVRRFAFDEDVAEIATRYNRSGPAISCAVKKALGRLRAAMSRGVR